MFANSCFTLVGVLVLCLSNIVLTRNIEEPQTQGLYERNDDVLIINNDTFQERIFNQEHATLLEFYNSFCGHCRRFAPIWKAFATDVIAWQRVVQIAAVDCSADENNALCRKYEVMAYPSLRYFPPHFNDSNNYGNDVPSEHDPTALRSLLVEVLRNETQTPSHWPNLQAADFNKQLLFVGQSEQVHFIFLIYTPSNGTLANQLALDFITSPNIAVRWISSSTVAHSYGMSNVNSLSVVNRKLEVYPMSIHLQERQELHRVILRFLKEHNMTAPSTIKPNRVQANPITKTTTSVEWSDNVSLNDLEKAVWFSLHREITQIELINGDRHAALKQYINIIKRYLPIGHSGQQFLSELDDYVSGSSEIRGEHFATKYSQLMSKWNPVNETSPWIECEGSTPNVRGYTCGLWELFHFLTVQLAADTYASDPREALTAIHGYVKHFFGCTDCAQHFQTLAEENHMWRVSSKDDAIVWLWKAHNQVNERLSGDITEDPVHPKIQFPTQKSCVKCRDPPAIDNEINWNYAHVLQFVKEHYSIDNINRSKNRRSVGIIARADKSTVDIGLSSLDMRIGIVLYVFCIGMVIFAVKMFIRRGYRKKLYSYDYKDNV